MPGRPAFPPDSSDQPRRALRRPANGSPGRRGFIARTGGVRGLLLMCAGFGLTLAIGTTTVLYQYQPNPAAGSDIVSPAGWGDAEGEADHSEAARRAAERQAELDRARRAADRSQRSNTPGTPTGTAEEQEPDDNEGPPVGARSESPRGHDDSDDDSAASKPSKSAEPTEEPREPAPTKEPEPTREPEPTKEPEPTRSPEPTKEASKAPEPTEEPAPSSTPPKDPEPTPSAEPTDEPSDPTPSASATPTGSPQPGDDEDDRECKIIDLLGLVCI